MQCLYQSYKRRCDKHPLQMHVFLLVPCSSGSAMADSLPAQTNKVLCDAECTAKLESVEAVTLPSGLVYKDIALGEGPNPPVGFQVRGQGDSARRVQQQVVVAACRTCSSRLPGEEKAATIGGS